MPKKKYFNKINCRFSIFSEVRDKAKNELFHILYMAKVTSFDKESTPELSEVTADFFMNEKRPSEALLQRWKQIISLFEENKLF